MSSQKNVQRPRSILQSEKLKTSAAIGLSLAMLMPVSAMAQEAEADEAPLATVTVEDTAIDPNPNAQLGVPYKARTSGDERHTRPLAETPQTISVLTRAQIEDSGYTDLVRILDAQPGISVGTGENGNAFGDRYIIRGQEARSDVFVDGLRDPGMTTRESFAIEQLEISKGPNSTFAGRGTSGGAINAITKQATTDYNFNNGSIGVGSDRFLRATADINYSTGNDFAVRANVLYGYQEVPDRGPSDRERKGLALSALYTPSDDLSINLDYYGLRAKDNPDLGDVLDANREPRVTPGSYAPEEDFQKSDVDTFTGRIKYSFSPDVRVTNLTRYGQSDNGYVVSGARNATTGANNPGGIYPVFTVGNSSTGWQDVEYFANQTNLYVNAGAHEFVLGAEYTDHKVLNGVYDLIYNGGFNCITGNGAVLNARCITDANGDLVSGVHNLQDKSIEKGRWDQDWGVETISGYLMDTFDLTTELTAFAGVRVDHYKYKLGLQSNALVVTNYEDSDTFWNGHLGLTYKIGSGMIYASAATASDINGGESDVGSSGGYGGFIIPGAGAESAKPERSLNFEIGTKWNILNERLLLTAAVFQTTKSDLMEGADYNAEGTYNTGKARVRGVEFGVAGNVTDAWSMQGGITYMESEVLESADSGLTTPVTNVGKSLANFSKFHAQFQTRYQVTDKFAIGAAVKHKSRQYGGQPDTAAPYTTNPDGSFFYTRPVPGYTVGDLFAEYEISDNIDLRLNVNNITNETYYTAVYRGGFFLYKGDARQVVGTVNFRF